MIFIFKLICLKPCQTPYYNIFDPGRRITKKYIKVCSNISMLRTPFIYWAMRPVGKADPVPDYTIKYGKSSRPETAEL